MLNGGVPALELIVKEKDSNGTHMQANAAYDNKGVIIVDDLPTTAAAPGQPAMIENYKDRMADVIAMLDKQQEYKEKAQAQGKRADVVDTEAKNIVDQK